MELSDVIIQTCSYHTSQQWLDVYGCWSLSIQNSPGIHWLRRWAVVLYHIMPVNDIVIIRDMWVTVCTNTDIQRMNNYYTVLHCSNYLCLIYIRFHASPQIHHGLLVHNGRCDLWMALWKWQTIPFPLRSILIYLPLKSFQKIQYGEVILQTI